jgi:predicted nuclease with TOPRIM domain
MNVQKETTEVSVVDRELQDLRVEVSQLKENLQFLLNYYRMKVTEKSEEVEKLKRIHSQKQ